MFEGIFDCLQEIGARSEGIGHDPYRDFAGKHVHFIGIGGISMSGLAEILLERGYRVSGSDLRQSGLTARLKSKGATVYQGHNA